MTTKLPEETNRKAPIYTNHFDLHFFLCYPFFFCCYKIFFHSKHHQRFTSISLAVVICPFSCLWFFLESSFLPSYINPEHCTFLNLPSNIPHISLIVWSLTLYTALSIPSHSHLLSPSVSISPDLCSSALVITLCFSSSATELASVPCPLFSTVSNICVMGISFC